MWANAVLFADLLNTVVEVWIKWISNVHWGSSPRLQGRAVTSSMLPYPVCALKKCTSTYVLCLAFFTFCPAYFTQFYVVSWLLGYWNRWGLNRFVHPTLVQTNTFRRWKQILFFLCTMRWTEASNGWHMYSHAICFQLLWDAFMTHNEDGFVHACNCKCNKEGRGVLHAVENHRIGLKKRKKKLSVVCQVLVCDIRINQCVKRLFVINYN